ncbi:MAG: transposase zinc-binding domain-containing protein [Acidobacteria bacterium]|nr:transposase zinc-binding domain-containing protein [Acidobacteriota bacterium]
MGKRDETRAHQNRALTIRHVYGELTITCRNRHCPKCLTRARNQWLAERERELLPVGYAHVVFTLPHVLAGLALQNKRVVYALLSRQVRRRSSRSRARPGISGRRSAF